MTTDVVLLTYRQALARLPKGGRIHACREAEKAVAKAALEVTP